MEHKPLRLHVGATTYPGVSHSGRRRRHSTYNNTRSSTARPPASDASGPVDADADVIASSLALGLNMRGVFDGVAHVILPKTCVRRVLSYLVACWHVTA